MANPLLVYEFVVSSWSNTRPLYPRPVQTRCRYASCLRSNDQWKIAYTGSSNFVPALWQE